MFQRVATSTRLSSSFMSLVTTSTTHNTVCLAVTSARSSTYRHVDRRDCNSLPLPVTWRRCVGRLATGATRWSSITSSSTCHKRVSTASLSSTSRTHIVQSRSV